MSAYAEELFTPRASHADEFAEAALEAIQRLPDGACVLDIGCGSGDLIKRAQRPGISFVGVDISRPNIEMARAACPNADFHCADFLVFDGGQFDVVLANSIFHLIGCSDARLIWEIAKATKHGGTLVAAVPVYSTKNHLLSLQRKLWKLFPTFLEARIMKFLPQALRERMIYLKMPPTRLIDERFISAMEYAGFCLQGIVSMRAKHPLKLNHSVVVWKRQGCLSSSPG